MRIKSVWERKHRTVKHYDTFTICFDKIANPEESLDYLVSLGTSLAPTTPQCFSAWGSEIEGDHLGKQIKFTELPALVQEHVLARIKEAPAIKLVSGVFKNWKVRVCCDQCRKEFVKDQLVYWVEDEYEYFCSKHCAKK